MFALAFVAGCTLMPPTVEVPPHELATAIKAWDAAGMPWRHRCDEQIHLLRKVIAPDVGTIAELCMSPNPKIVAGCYVTSAGGGFLDLDDHHPLIVVLEAYDTRDTDTHELMHWLAQCSGLHPDADHDHLDQRIWGPGGTKAYALTL